MGTSNFLLRLNRCMGLLRAPLHTTAINFKYELINSHEENKFLLKLNSHYAYVNYIRKGEVYELVATYVPEEYEGHGIGPILAKKTFEYIAKKDCKIYPACDYLKAFYKANRRKYQKFIVD